MSKKTTKKTTKRKDGILYLPLYLKINVINDFLQKSDFKFKYIFLEEPLYDGEITVPLGVDKLFIVYPTFTEVNNTLKNAPKLKMPFGVIVEEARNYGDFREAKVNLNDTIDDFKTSKYDIYNISNQKIKPENIDGEYYLSLE